MEKKNLTLIFNHFELEHLGKDVFLVPYYLGKINNLNVTIVCPLTNTNKELASEINGVKIIRLPLKEQMSKKMSFYYSKPVLKYLLKNAKSISFLMTFHCSLFTFLMLSLYKLLNSKGKTYIKADGAQSLLEINEKQGLKRRIYEFLWKKIDIISIELEDMYNRLLNEFPFPEKYRYIPNGFNEDELKSSGIDEATFEQKENIFITVGRIGSYLKNTELILDAVKDLEFSNWKLYLIGPIEQKEQNFQHKIDVFF